MCAITLTSQFKQDYKIEIGIGIEIQIAIEIGIDPIA